MPLVADGHYEIFNAQYTSLDADLFVGWPIANIVDYTTNSASFNMVVRLCTVVSVSQRSLRG